MTQLLIVDDMAVLREPIAASLRREGFDAVCASSGAEALELMCAKLPDLILLDIAMPVMDGLSFLKVIRKRPELCDIPVIMLTALSERETLKEAVQVGVQGYLLKSQFSLEDLVERVRKVLDARDSSERPPEPSSASANPESPATEELIPPQIGRPPTPLSRAETLEQIHRDAKLRAVPTVLSHVLSLTGSSRSSFDDVAGAVRRDHALSLKVMRVANSSFFGAGAGIQTLTEAAQRIGMSGVRNTIGSILTIEHFTSSSTGGLTPQRFWEHSLATAALADGIGHAIGMADCEHVFLAGLMHDVGRLVLSTLFPDRYEWVVQTSAERNVKLLDVEREAFGLGHDEATKELLIQWQTPEEIHEAARAHELSVDRIQQTVRDAESALVVALANRLAHAAVLGDSGNPMLLSFHDHAKALKLKGDSIRALVDEAVEKTRETEIFYASRTEQDFRGPLVDDLRQRDGAIADARVFASGAPGDPVSVIGQQLGWTGSRKARCAIFYTTSPRGWTTHFRELLQFEDGIGARLPVLVVSPAEVAPPPTELFEGRESAHVELPARYDFLLDTVETLCGPRAPALVGDEQG